MSVQKLIGRTVLALLAIVTVGALLGYSPLQLAGSLTVGAPFIFGMAALSADRITVKKMTANEKAYPVKTNVKIWAGGMVAIDAAGFAVAAADAASQRVVGVAKSSVDNTGGADGALNVNVEEGLFLFSATSITQGMVGQVMYVIDDQTFDDVLGTNGLKAGRLLEFFSTTSGWIYIRPSGVGSVLANADATYGQPEADLINEIKGIVNKWL